MKIRFRRIGLRGLILGLCVFFVVLALANSFFAAYQVQRDVLVQNTLELNRVYAQKLAQVTDSFIRSSRHMLEATAQEVGEFGFGSVEGSSALQRLFETTDNFNSMIAVNTGGQVVMAEPPTLAIRGLRLLDPHIRHTLNVRYSTVSAPVSGEHIDSWLVLITQPVFSNDGDYMGFIGGNIYLHERNGLQTALGEHYYKDGSYLYVFDQSGTLIYHPDAERIGSTPITMPVVQAALRGERGAMSTEDEHGIEVLAGYAPVPSTGWGIVAQRPLSAAVAGLDDLFLRVFYYTLPLTALSLIAIWWLAHLISRPLRELAGVASSLGAKEDFNRIRYIRGWYMEAALIRQALMAGFSAVSSRMRKLHRETATDALTGLVNVRGLEMILRNIEEAQEPAALVIFDIDHFKKVNDTHGHGVGDHVLRQIAKVAKETVRGGDSVARSGGEEFVIVLPGATATEALQMAQRLCERIRHSRFDHDEEVTISAGIAHYPSHADTMDEVRRLADMALYSAKRSGRNCARVLEVSDAMEIAVQP